LDRDCEASQRSLAASLFIFGPWVATEVRAVSRLFAGGPNS